MTWAKLSGGATLIHTLAGGVNPPDFWAQIDLWIPANTFTACDDGNLNGASASFLDFQLDDISMTTPGFAPGPWRWQSAFSTAPVGPAAGTTYTVEAHFYPNGVGGSTVDWYANGSLVMTSHGVANNASTMKLLLGSNPEDCCCETYYVTNVKLGTSRHNSNLFSDDFSGGLGNWQSVPSSGTSSITLVAGPTADSCPTLTVTPGRGQAGDTITIDGSGFAHLSPLTLYFENLPDEEFSHATDGSGNIHATTVIPYGIGYDPLPGDDHAVTLQDAAGNVGCATITVCGSRNSDGITSLPDPVVAEAGLSNTTNAILDYIWHDGAHWVLWQDTSVAGNSTTFPPPNPNHTMNATRISADGSSVTDYPLDSGYCWHFDKDNPRDPGIFEKRDCGFFGFRNRPVWSRQFYFTAWEKPIYDTKFASDGTTLWVGLLTRETVPYAWIDDADSQGQYPGSLGQFVPIEELTSGYTDFATTADTGYLRYNTQTWGPPTGDYAEFAFPVSDNGEADSGHWSPPIVVMYAFSGSGFNRIGDIPALYCPGLQETTGIRNGLSGLLNVPKPQQGSPRGSLYSRISLAASPRDPGVCHLVWSEGGDWGRCGAGNCLGKFLWDSGPFNRSYRINYTRWAAGGKVFDTDLFSSYIDRENWFFEFDGDNSGNIEDTGHTWPDQDDLAAAVCHELRNDNPNGTPYLFLSWPQTDYVWNVNPSGLSFMSPPPVMPDQFGEPWLDKNIIWGDTLHVYDLSSGSAVLVQEIANPGPLIPTEEECNLAYGGNLLNVPPFASDIFLGPTLVYDGDNFVPRVTLIYDNISGPTRDTGNGTVLAKAIDKGFGISNVYDDPELGVPVYLVHVPWARAWANTVAGHINGAGQYSGAAMRGFYRVPADMSAGFDMLDGFRQYDFTIVKDGPPPDAFAPGFPSGWGSGDFWNEAHNIWLFEATQAPGTGSFGYFGAWFDKVCQNRWEAATPYVPSPVGQYTAGAECPGFYYNPGGDSVSYVEGYPNIVDGSPLFRVVNEFICRGCNTCRCGEGVHLAHRF